MEPAAPPTCRSGLSLRTAVDGQSTGSPRRSGNFGCRIFAHAEYDGIARVVVRVAEGAPVAAFAVAVAPIAPDPLVPVVSTPVELTVIDDCTDCENVAVTVPLVSAVDAKHAENSNVPSCVFVRCTNTHVRLAPATPLTVVVVAVPFARIKASSSSLVEEVENVAMASVVAAFVPSAK